MSYKTDENSTAYTLSFTLQSDLAPVRSLCYLSESNTLLAGSQQALLTRYFLNENHNKDGGSATASAGGVSMDTFQEGHSHAISVLLQGCNGSNSYVSGCKDGIVRVLQDKAVLRELRGHQSNVSSLSWLPDGSLVSGSWDGTARVWNVDSGECVQVLPDHENTTVVLGLPNGCIVTGSAGVAQNNSIVGTKLRLWQKVNGLFECVMKIPYPTGPIRNMCLIPGSSHAPPNQMMTEETILFATCSNDSTVKIWDSHGDCKFTFEHPGQPMVLSVMAGPDGTIVSTTEDGDLVIWSYDNSVQPVQTIRHSSTVWCSTLLFNDDIVSACQDGSVRFFTRDANRVCSESELKEFEEKGMRAASGPSNEEISKLPRWEMRQVVVGKSEGQVQMFQKDDGAKAIAAQWSQSSNTWIEVGEVLSTRDTSNSGTIDGVSYTHVFPIEFEASGGVHTLKIGYNDGDNPFVVAQAFIDKHELPQYHLQQIADYIIARVGQTPVQLGGDASTTQHSQAASSVTSAPVIKEYKNLPHKYCITFRTDLLDPKKIIDKIKVLNNEIEDSMGQLSPDDIESIECLLMTLANTSHYHSSKISSQELDILCRVLQNWPCAQIFPIVDILKMCVLHPDASSVSRWDYWQLVTSLALKKCDEALSDSSKGAAIIPTLAMRLIANTFKNSGSVKGARQLLSDILQCINSHLGSNNKNTRLAISTVLLNISCLMSNDDSVSMNDPIFEEMFKILLLAINSPSYADSRVTISRLLLAIGTVTYIVRSKGVYKKQHSELLAAVARISNNDVVDEVIDVLTL